MHYAAGTQSSSAGLPVELLGFQAILAFDKRNSGFYTSTGSRRIMPHYTGQYISAKISSTASKEDFLQHGAANR